MKIEKPVTTLFASIVVFGIFAQISQPAMAQSEAECIPYLRGKLRDMMSGAEQCGVSAAQMRTFPEENNVDYGCHRPLSSQPSQLNSFQSCARVYYCAGRFYRCAISAKNSGSDCRSAMNGCVANNPVPR